MTLIKLLLVTIVYQLVFLERTIPCSKRCHFQSNIFGKPSEVKRRPDINSMTASELNKFISQCKNIENRIKSVSDDENEEDFFNSMVDSKY